MIKITKGDLTFHVESETELKTVLNVLQANHGPSPKKARKSTSEKVSSLPEFLEMLGTSSKQYELLTTLRRKPDGMGDEELRIALGLKSGHALGGTLARIRTQAKKHGVEFDDVIERSISQGKDKTLHHYRLTQKMTEVIPMS